MKEKRNSDCADYAGINGEGLGKLGQSRTVVVSGMCPQTVPEGDDSRSGIELHIADMPVMHFDWVLDDKCLGENAICID